eukprot:367365_1
MLSFLVGQQQHAINVNILRPGTWIKRPISKFSETELSMNLLYHHAIYIHPNIIVEYNNNNQISFVVNEADHIWKQKWMVVKQPRNKQESNNIIQMILNKYYQSNTIYNREHFVSLCYGNIKSKQSTIYAMSFGVAISVMLFCGFYSYVTKSEPIKCTQRYSEDMEMIETDIPMPLNRPVEWETFLMNRYYKTKHKAQMILSLASSGFSMIIGAVAGFMTFLYLTKEPKIIRIVVENKCDLVNEKMFDRELSSHTQLKSYLNSLIE